MQSELRNLLAERYPQRFLDQNIEHYGKDWTRGFTSNPGAVIFPKNSLEVSEILKLCQQYSQAVVPSGGRTGLAAGAYAQNSELVISLEKMNRILGCDLDSASIEVEAGVVTQDVQETAKDHGFFFGIDLAAKGSSQIGGNIATNAGGTKFIRYGSMRDQVLGLEVVLANGDILDLNSSLRKNNSGYDLKQLFIGSEGTLGIITKATLKLCAPPKERGLALFALDAFANSIEILKRCYLSAITPTAVEYISKKAMDFSSNKNHPFDKEYPFYVLLEYELQPGCEKFLECLFEDLLCVDGLIADSSTSFHQLWSYREKITESIANSCHVHKNDISLAIKDLPAFIKKVELLSKQSTHISLVTFGHIGDGNMHLNYTVDRNAMSETEFQKYVHTIECEIMQFIKGLKGSMSAEHGIGLLKKQYLEEFIGSTQLFWMRQLKKSLDPKCILNPGKIFDQV